LGRENWALDDDAVCYLETEEGTPPFSGGGDSGQHRAVKDEQNERPEPAAPAILSFLVRCQKDLVAISLLLPCRLPIFLR